MKKFGESLRKIRESKGVTIKQAAGHTVTPAFLSKFERGESEISFSKLIEILDHINVDIDEFLLQANNFEKYPQNIFLSGLSDAVDAKSNVMLKNLEETELLLYKKEKNIRYKHNIYLCRLYATIVNETEPNISDWEPIKNYLFGVEDWSYYEFLLYANAIPFLPTEIIELLSKSVYQKGMRYLSLTENKNGLTETLLNTIEILIKRDRLDMAATYFTLVESLLDSPDSIFEMIRLKLYHGAILYMSGNSEEGLQNMDNAIKALNMSGYRGNQIPEFEKFEKIIVKKTI